MSSRSDKGKCTTRQSWSDLPHHVVRHIADILCSSSWAVHSQHPLPSWREPHWTGQQRLWTTIWVGRALEAIALTCRDWETAMECYPFWNQASTILDPQYMDPQYQQLVHQVSQASGAKSILPHVHLSRTYSMYSRILRSSCLPCRFASPSTSHGINVGREWAITRHLSHILVCRQHIPEKFCGICLKDARLSSFRWTGSTYQLDIHACTITPVDEDPYFEDVVATCGHCRRSAVWVVLRQRNHSRRNEVINNVVEQYAQSGEGTIKDVIQDAEERSWLALHSNYEELHQSAIVAERLRFKQEMKMNRQNQALEGVQGRLSASGDDMNGMHEAIQSDDVIPVIRAAGSQRLRELLESSAPVSPSLIEREIELQEQNRMEECDEEDEEDDDMLEEDFLSYSEEANVRDMALSGWVRSRIMDGCWVTPFDLSTKLKLWDATLPFLHRLAPAFHPLESQMAISSHNLHPSVPGTSTLHPSLSTLHAPPPPARLLYRSQAIFEHNMRQILLPPLKNLVRRLVRRCQVQGKDVCRLVIAVTPEQLLQELRTMQVWGAEYSLDGSSDEHQGSSTTSPHGDSDSDRDSSSTLRTSPSPPRSHLPNHAMEESTPQSPLSHGAHSGLKLPVPIRFVQHVPYVPTSMEHVGPQGLQLVELIWREACAALFRCRCGVCRRAIGLEMTQEAHRQAQVVVETQSHSPQAIVPSMLKEKPQTPVIALLGQPDEVEEPDDVSVSDDYSSPGPLTPPDIPLRRRSRELNETKHSHQLDEEIRERKRARITPPPHSNSIATRDQFSLDLTPAVRRRRSREDEYEDANPASADVEMGRKKIRVTQSVHTTVSTNG